MNISQDDLATIIENRKKTASTPVFPPLGKLSDGRYKSKVLTKAEKERRELLESAKNKINLGYDDEYDDPFE